MRRLRLLLFLVGVPALAAAVFLHPGLRARTRTLLPFVRGDRTVAAAAADDSTSAQAALPSRAARAEPDGGPGGEPASNTLTMPLPVRGAVVRAGDFVLTVRGSGRAEAIQQADLALRVADRVRALHVTEGQHVRQGQLLLELDPALFQIALDEARAATTNAEIDARLRLLADSLATDEKRELVAHRAGLTAARQQLARAEHDLAETKLLAPFAGEVAAIQARVGERTQANAPLITLVALDVLRVPVEVLETDFGRLRPGARARLTFPALPGETFEGRISALSPRLDAQRGTGIAWVQLPNPRGTIRPGMYADVEIDADTFADRLSVPRDAVLERDRRLLVFRTRGQRAEWQYVQTGLENDARIEITSGLAAGDTVLVEGHLTLAHGARVDVSLRPD